MMVHRFPAGYRLACFLALTLVAGGRTAPAAGNESGALVRDVERLIELRLTLQRETVQWERQRAVIQRRIDLLERERNTLLEQLRAGDQAREEREAAVRAEDARLAEADETFARAAAHMAPVRALVAAARDRAAEGLQEALPPAGMRADDLAESLGDLIRLAVALHRLDQEVHVTHLTLAAPDGTQRRFEALFLGLAQAYIVSADQRMAAHGVRTEREWLWTWNPEWAGDIRRALGVAQGSLPLRRIPLPVGLAARDETRESRR